jgi:hypothetical protein
LTLKFNIFIRTSASESNNKSKEPCHCGQDTFPRISKAAQSANNG